MMARIFPLLAAFFFAVFFSFSAAPSAQALEAGLRTHDIEIRSDFAGTRLLVFGALEKDRRQGQNIVIVARGPQRHGVVWRKERVAGIWTNYLRADFPVMAGFYALVAAQPVNGRLASDFSFHKKPRDEQKPAATPEFIDALARLMRAKGLIYEAPHSVEFLGSRLFRAEIVLPAGAPVGDYQIGIYLLEGGRERAREILSLHVDKIGFGQFIFSFANDWPFFYGLAAVIIALSFGWLMSIVFRRLI